MRECEYCAENIESNEKICNFCGEKQSKIINTKKSDKTLNKTISIKQNNGINIFKSISTLISNNYKNIIIVLLVTILISGLIFFISSNTNKEVKIVSSKDIYKSIVKVEYHDNIAENDYIGSGIMFSKDGLILTNNHIIENSNFGTAMGNIKICITEDTTKLPDCSYDAELIIRNTSKDLAILKIQDYNTENYIDLFGQERINESETRRYRREGLDNTLFGKELKVYGFPGLGGEKITITKGIVAGFDSDNNIKTDAEVNPGNSGGGAFIGNEFLGIPSFLISEDSGKISYIISKNTINRWFHEILSFNPKGEYTKSDFNFDNLEFEGDDIGIESIYPGLIIKYAWIETNTTEYEKVIKKGLEIIELKPDSPLVYLYMGDAYSGLEEYEIAIKFYKLAIALGSVKKQLYLNYGIALGEVNRYEDSIKIFEIVLNIIEDESDKSIVYVNIGYIYGLMGNSKSSLDYYNLALEIDPNNEKLKKIINGNTVNTEDFIYGDEICKNTYGNNGYYTGEKASNGSYLCLCYDGYDFSDYNDICVSTKEYISSYYALTSRDINLRNDHGISGSIIKVIDKGSKIKVISKNDVGGKMWYEIEYGMDTGWISYIGLGDKISSKRSLYSDEFIYY